MIHIFGVIYNADVSFHSFVVLDEVLFEIHNVLIGRLFGAVDID